MLFPKSHAWTLRQRWFIVGAIIAGVVAFSAIVHSYERYYRGRDDRFFVGTWRGEYVDTLFLGDPRVSYCFKSDHTYDELVPDSAAVFHRSRWYAGGDFIYLRVRKEDANRWSQPLAAVKQVEG